MEIYDLWPLAHDEIMGERSLFLDTLRNGAFSVEWQDIAIHLATGGYPESVRCESQGDRASWFESYMRTIFQKDIRDLANIEGLSEIPNTLKMLAIRIGSTRNIASISRPTILVESAFLRCQHGHQMQRGDLLSRPGCLSMIQDCLATSPAILVMIYVLFGAQQARPSKTMYSWKS
jgi:hypothetical protein